jgi:hypothetical protein
MPITHTGGSSEKALKKLYGAAFKTPSSSTAEINAIGRGIMVDVNNL